GIGKGGASGEVDDAVVGKVLGDESIADIEDAAGTVGSAAEGEAGVVVEGATIGEVIEDSGAILGDGGGIEGGDAVEGGGGAGEDGVAAGAAEECIGDGGTEIFDGAAGVSEDLDAGDV